MFVHRSEPAFDELLIVTFVIVDIVDDWTNHHARRLRNSYVLAPMHWNPMHIPVPDEHRHDVRALDALITISSYSDRDVISGF